MVKNRKEGYFMDKYRINAYVTNEAGEFIKQETKRLGASIGVLLTMWALDKKREQSAFKAIEMADRLEQQNTFKK